MDADHHVGVTEPRLRSGDRSLLYQADTLDLLAEFDDESIDAVVTDPPYGLEFMGKEWDSFRVDERAARWSGGASGGAGGFGAIPGGAQLPSYSRRRKTAVCAVCGKRDAFRNPHECGDAAEWRVVGVDDVPVEMRAFQNWCTQWAAECYRILKPGGHLLAFGGTRTYHRLACAVEDVGFDVRDSLVWLYGSGFPKSLDVAKAIDKAAGHWRGQAGEVTSSNDAMAGPNYERTEKGDPVTAAAAAWDGWGTALKPAHEPIVVARKPTIGSVRENVVAHGTGAINIDATRVGDTGGTERAGESPRLSPQGAFTTGHAVHAVHAGRWPPNVLLTHASECGNGGVCVEGCPVGVLDEQSGYGVSPRSRSPDPPAAATWSLGREGGVQVGHDDAGGASRFFPRFADEPDDDAVARDPGFMYVPKASSAQREAGTTPAATPAGPGGWEPRERGNVHPTVKPVGLMRWLVRLVTPPGGIVLDPFAGSGSTLVACIAEGVEWIGVEREADYCTIIEQRVAAARRAVRAQQAAERVRVHREQQG